MLGERNAKSPFRRRPVGGPTSLPFRSRVESTRPLGRSYVKVLALGIAARYQEQASSR